MPDPAAQKAALALVNEAYKDDIAKAIMPQQQADLAKKLLQTGIETQEPAGRFVLLNKAKDTAAQAGDLETAFAAAAEITNAFQIDALRMNAESVVAAARAIRPVNGFVGLVEKTNQFIDTAMAADRYELAGQAADVALTTARRAPDPMLVRQGVLRKTDVQTRAAAFAKLQVPLATLVVAPTDPDANLAVGRFECFFKGNWDGGLSMLALGRDATLKALAARERAGTVAGASQMAVADGWWAVAEKEEGSAKTQIQQHAGVWYSVCVENLTGLDKAKAEARLKSLGGLDKSTTDAGLTGRAGDESARPVLATGGPIASAKPVVASVRQIDSGKPAPAADGRTFQNTVGMRFVEIKPGTFTMGTREDEAGRSDNETQHQVIIAQSFYMGRTLVTQAQWNAVMGTDPSHIKGDDLPVEQVSWNDAVAFCATLSKKEGRHYHLPTEAQWEYACRAGTQTAYNTGNDSAALAKAGWFAHNSQKTTHPVAQKLPNAWGLYDMHGNVWEWCSDWLADYQEGEQKDPAGPAHGAGRVTRGGSWHDDPRNCRSGCRAGSSPGHRHGLIGFRVALDLN